MAFSVLRHLDIVVRSRKDETSHHCERLSGGHEKIRLSTFVLVRAHGIGKDEHSAQYVYMLQTVPILLPFLLSLKHCFIYRPSSSGAIKGQGFNWLVLMISKSKGGECFPNFRLKNLACLLARIVDWHHHSLSKDWIHFDSDISGTPVTVTVLPCLSF